MLLQLREQNTTGAWRLLSTTSDCSCPASASHPLGRRPHKAAIAVSGVITWQVAGWSERIEQHTHTCVVSAGPHHGLHVCTSSFLQELLAASSSVGLSYLLHCVVLHRYMLWRAGSSMIVMPNAPIQAAQFAPCQLCSSCGTLYDIFCVW